MIMWAVKLGDLYLLESRASQMVIASLTHKLGMRVKPEIRGELPRTKGAAVKSPPSAGQSYEPLGTGVCSCPELDNKQWPPRSPVVT